MCYFRKIYFSILKLCVCVSMCVCVCVHGSAGAQSVQKRASDPLQTVVNALMWVLGTELGSLPERHAFLTAQPSLLPF